MVAGEKEEEQWATLQLPDGRVHKVRMLKPQLGSEQFLDIRDLFAKTNCLTYDPGFTSTGSCMSGITYIDGPIGKCLYRGYPVADLCENSSFMEVSYLLLVGDLPTDEENAKWSREVKLNMRVHEKVKSMYSQFLNNAHPMAIMVAVVGSLSTVYSDLDPFDNVQRWAACTKLIAKLPTLSAMAYKASVGQPMMYPRADLSMSENFLYMMFATPMEPYVVNPVIARAIDAFMILHMDHEQNASTSTVRIAGSSQANPYACIAAGVASLWGPAHGGANEAVIKMLDQIGTKDKVAQFVADVKAKKEGVRLMGFGHRVYKNYDPRAKYMKTLVQKVLSALDVSDPKLEVAMELERVALGDEYFIQRKLYPNVDYYSGIMLSAIGIPTSMFTVMFAMSRTVGWVSHWNEMIQEAQLKIGRPRQLYVGVEQRSYPNRPAETSEEQPALQRRKSFSEKQAADEIAFPRRNTSFKEKVPDVATR